MSGRLLRQRQRVWHVIDAKDEVVGRLAVQVAALLQGKSKPTYRSHADSGDEVVIINARHAMFSGSKLKQKMYYKHSGYPGGLKARTARDIQERHPEKIMELAVKRMLPDNRMRKHVWLKRLRVYADDEHPHDSQVNRSASYAPGWLDYGKPLSKKVESDVQIVPFRDDVFGPETPASEWAPGTLSPETDDKDEVAEMFKERWAQEIEFWKKERQGIPEYIYDMHDMPKPEGGEDLTPEEAHAAFLRNLDEFRKTRDADPAWKDFWKGVGDGAEPGSQEENPVFAKYKLHEAEAKEPARKGKKGGRAKPGAGSGVVPVMPKWGKVPVGASALGAGWKTVYDARAGAEAGQAGGRQ